jgi:hypothetical protein
VALAAAGKPTCSLVMPGGERILLLPHGGRVLGLFPAHDDENFYWTHPALEKPDTARAFYSSGAWENSGGDRTWLSPELDIFFPGYPDLNTSGYFQPRQLDPGSYVLEERGGAVQLVNRLSLNLYRSKARVDLEIRKWVIPAANPLRYERNVDALSQVQYAGYTQHTALAINGGDEARVGLWNLIQMPHGGDMIVPVYSRSDPRICFGSIPSEDLVVTDHAIRWKMHASGAHKIGVRAIATTGRAGYYYRSGESANLIVRDFTVDPSGEYIDVPWDDPDDLGYAMQACNVDNHMGSFSELEYHVPAIGCGTGLGQCEDVSRVRAFRGPRRAVEDVMARLLFPGTSTP